MRWLLFLLLLPGPALALGDRQEVSCGVLAERGIVESDIKIICGMTPAEFADNMRLALSNNPEDHEELFARLDGLLPEGQVVQGRSLRRFFRILGEAEVPPEQLQDRLAEIATRHRELLEEIRTFRVRDP